METLTEKEKIVLWLRRTAGRIDGQFGVSADAAKLRFVADLIEEYYGVPRPYELARAAGNREDG
jgi:hypothetical protein